VPETVQTLHGHELFICTKSLEEGTPAVPVSGTAGGHRVPWQEQQSWIRSQSGPGKESVPFTTSANRFSKRGSKTDQVSGM